MAEVEMAMPAPAATGAPAEAGAAWNWNRVLSVRNVLLLLPVAGLILWGYWDFLNPFDLNGDGYPDGQWTGKWDSDEAWSHGWFIPVIAVLIAHYRLRERNPRAIQPCAWGLLLVLAGFVLRVWPQMLKFGYPGQVTFILVVAGAVLWLLGWEMFKALWVPIAYLWLMIPWPQRIYDFVAQPAQTMAAAFTERVLVLADTFVVRRGNVLELESGPLMVAEACSGLRLLMAFVALGVMLAFIYRRPLWERLIIIGSSVPIAVFCNFIRVLLMAVSSNALWREAGRLEAAQPTWSAWMPQVTAWPSEAWVGLVLLLLGLFLLATPGATRGLRLIESPLAKVGMIVAGGVVVLFSAGIVLGYSAPAQLEELRQTIIDPESAPHQAFGFAMLGLAFVLMWLELTLIDRFLDALFISEEEEAEGGAGPTEPRPAAAAADPGR